MIIDITPNDYQVGTLYYKNGFNNVKWTQPGGPFTKVLPVTQVQANSNLFTTEAFSELTGVFMFGCGHSVNMVRLELDYDHQTKQQVGLICCPTCCYVSRVISPWIQAYNPLTAAILTP